MLALVSAFAATAQTTNSTPTQAPFAIPGINLNFLTNIPTVQDFTKMKIGLETGVASQNSVVANYIKGDYYLGTNWMLSGEIQNAPVSTTIESASIYAGYRKVWANAELYTEVGARRNFAGDGDVIPSYQSGALFGASWIPMTGGNMALTASLGVWTSPNAAFSQKPNTEIRGGFKVGF